MKLTGVEGICGGMRRMGWWLALAALLMLPAGRCASAQGISTTTVQGTVYLANGQPGAGTLVLSWPSFTTTAGQTITADQLTVTIPTDGFVSVSLAPNLGATPAGEYYTATYYMSDGSTSTQYWVVPAAAQATVAQVQAQVMPAVEAVQAVSKAYVDQSIAELQQSQLTTSGGTFTGPLTLSGDPTQPLQAADKHYVDTQVATAVPLSGGTMTGSLTLSSDPSQAMQSADKEYVDAATANTWPAMVLRADQVAGADFGAKLQACVNAVSASDGGICDARNFSGNQTISSNLTISIANTTVLLPCATITTTNQIVVTAGTRNVALRGCAMRGGTTASGTQGGTVFAYSGAAAMIQVGDTTYAADTLGFHLDNVMINTTAATSAAAMGLAAYRTQEIDLAGVYFLGNANQTGMTLDGTGNYTGGTFLGDQFDGFQTAINAIGHRVANPATTDWMNASSFVRLHIDCPTSSGSPIAGTYGINLQQGDGNTFTGGDVEGCATALHLGANAQNNTIVGLRNENSTMQVVADTGSSYNSWITGGTMLAGELTDNGTRNSFEDTFHRSFNGLNGDWYGSQQDATVTNQYRLGIGAGNERGLLNEIQTDYGDRWLYGFSDATSGQQLYQLQDVLNNVNRLQIQQWNHGQSSTSNQTALNAARTGNVCFNCSTNSGTGGVSIASGGSAPSTVATVDNAGDAQFNGMLQVNGASQLAGTLTVRNNADAEVDYNLWPGLTASQKGSFNYKDWNGSSQWYMVKNATNDWALTSAVGGLDSFKAYQSTNSGDTYVNASNSAGTVRVNYESGSGTAFKIYGGNNSTLYASFTGASAIAFPGLAASSGHFCLQIDTAGNVTNSGAACGGGSGGSGTVNSSNSGYIAYYTATGTAIGGMSSVPVTAGGTGAASAAGALANLGALPLSGGTLTGTLGGTSASFSTAVTAASVNGVYDFKAQFGATGSNETMTCTATASSSNLSSCSGGDFTNGEYVYIPQAGASPTASTPSAPTAACGSDNGGSCTGSTTYCYKIAATQGSFDSWTSPPYPAFAAMTAPSSASCVTQATQTAASAVDTYIPDAYTTVSWSVPSGANGVAIYKSINGGPYYFYEVQSSGTTSMQDFNHAQSAHFTCTDLGWPCVAPSSSTPNGVFAKIASVNGSSYTLAANSLVPTNPYKPGISGTVTVQHDDTPAMAALYSALLANTGHGNIQVHIGTGHYMLHSYNLGTGVTALGSSLPLFGLTNVDFKGDGKDASFLLPQESMFAFGQCGWGSTVSCSTTSWGGSANGYALADPSNVGSSQITLSTPSQASNFTVGGYITIRDDASGYPQQFYAEINEVSAINSTTGVLTLAYPLTKTYSATLPAPYSSCSVCNGTPKAYPIVGGVTASNLTFEDMAIRGPALLFNYNTVDGLYFRNDDLEGLEFQEEGQSRHIGVFNNRIVEDPWVTLANNGGMLMAAAASADEIAEGNTYIALHLANPGRQECSEGSANVTDVDNVQLWSGSMDGSLNNSGGLYGESMCWNYLLANNNITVSKINLQGIFGGDGGYGGSGTMRNNTFSIDSVSGTQQASVVSAFQFGDAFTSPYIVVSDNKFLVGSGASNLGPATVNATTFQPVHGTVSFSSVSGGFSGIASNYYADDLFVVNLAGGYLSQVSLGNTRYAGYIFRVAFVQPATGPIGYFQGETCSSSFWGVNIDCSNQQPPAIQAGNGSVTVLTFYDDGTTVHYLGKNYKDNQYQAILSLGNESGGLGISAQVFGTFGVASMNMTGNISSINLGNAHIAGYLYAFEFTQPASGGPYSLPPDCTNNSWGTGSGIQCIGGVAPVANPAPGSSTILWFYDDGTNTWELGSNYNLNVTDGSGTTTSGLIAQSSGTAHQIQYSSSLPGGTTATTPSAGDNSTQVATTAYVASPGAIAPTTITATGLVSGANDTALTSSATMTNSWTTTGLVLPTVPVSAIKSGRCVIYWRMSSTSYTATFGLGMSNSPTDVWGGTSVTYNANGTSNWLAFTQSSTSTTAISTASTAASTNATYRAEIDFTIQTGSSNAVAMTLYGETSNSGATLTIEPGSACYWLP